MNSVKQEECRANRRGELQRMDNCGSTGASHPAIGLVQSASTARIPLRFASAALVMIGAWMTVGVHAADADSHFAVSTHQFTIVRQTVQGDVAEVATNMFKVDTVNGSVWRMETNVFRRIVVLGLPSQDEYVKELDTRKTRLMEERLSGIILPEINFRQASVSNVFARLEIMIREHDRTTPTNTNDGIRFRMIGFGESCFDPFATGDNAGVQNAGNITFSAKQVSALNVLKSITEINNIRYRMEGAKVVVMPCNLEEGCMETQRYQVAPTVQGHLTDTMLTNALVRFGVPRLNVGGSVSYTPEFGQITVVELPHRVQQIESILCILGVVDFTGRYRLVTGSDHGQALLLLQDHMSGETWRHQFVVKPDGTVGESFGKVPTFD